MKKLDPRSVLIGFLVAVIGFMSLGATDSTFDSITVGEIILKNQSMIFTGNNGKPILSITSGENANALFFINAAGKIVGSIAEDDAGNGSIDLFNTEGQKTIGLTATESNSGSIGLHNVDGQKTILITHNMANGGVIQIYNKYQKPAVYLSTTTEDDGHIILYDRYGEGQWGMTGKRK